MKRLKYSCPFGGKKYPKYLAGAAFIIPAILAIQHDLSETLMIACVIICPVIVLVLCLIYEQSLTDGERKIVADAEYPLWKNATPELIAQIQSDSEYSPLLMYFILAAGILIGASILATAGISRITVFIAGAVMLTVIGIFLYDRIVSDVWSQIDETAVYADIPIHHMYDVEHSRRAGPRYARYTRVWYENYIVFYLPDGRYVLHNRHKTEFGMIAVRIVKFRGHIRWFPQE